MCLFGIMFELFKCFTKKPTTDGLHEDLHSPAQTQYEMQRALLMDVVVRKRAATFQLLAGEDESLMVGRDVFLVLDLGLDVVDRVGGLDLKGDRLA
jgi:hypothetical protein